MPTASAPPTVTLGAAPGPMGMGSPTRTGLAIGALVCGIIGLVGCAPVGLVGVILGIVALSKISADPREYGGKGYAIGGIPPVGHATPLRTFIDEDLLAYPQVFAAAGTPHAVFELKPDDLVTITKGEVVDIK